MTINYSKHCSFFRKFVSGTNPFSTSVIFAVYRISDFDDDIGPRFPFIICTPPINTKEILNNELIIEPIEVNPNAIFETDKEYYAAKRNQKKLDKLNEQILADGLTPRKTTFQTQKQYLRDAITEISHIAKDVEDFKKQLYEKYQIVMTDHRGRFSYLHPEREKKYYRTCFRNSL